MSGLTMVPKTASEINEELEELRRENARLKIENEKLSRPTLSQLRDINIQLQGELKDERERRIEVEKILSALTNNL